MGAARVLWNKVAGSPPPSRRGQLWRSRRGSGGLCSWIWWSGELWCFGSARRCGGGSWPVKLLSLIPVFALVWFLLAISWGCWGWCAAALEGVVGVCSGLYRRESSSPSSFCGGGAVGSVEDDGGPEARWWSVEEGSGSLDPEQDDLGYDRRPMQLHWLDPTRRSWWILRLTNAFRLGVLPASCWWSEGVVSFSVAVAMVLGVFLSGGFLLVLCFFKLLLLCLICIFSLL